MVLSTPVSSASKEQIDYFNSLPKAQQSELAKQMGVNSPSKSKIDKSEYKPSVLPRTQQDASMQSLNEQGYKPVEAKVEPFGYDLFSGEPSSFMPSETAAVPDSYIVGRGDEFQINFYGKENLSHLVNVDREGRLSIPNLTPVFVAGLSFLEVKELIKNKISQEVIGVKAFVSLGQLRSMRIMVLGESFKPSSYTVSSLTTVSHALFVSGGVSGIGSLRNIQVKRAGKLIQLFDLYKLLIQGDSSQDIILKPGDVVFIPPVGKRVTIKGLVKRPAIFELKSNETSDDLIKMAGGVLPSTYIKRVMVERFSSTGLKKMISVDFTSKNQTYIPEDGDIIKFNPNSEQYENSVQLIGAVTRPGQYQWFQGQKVSDVIKSINGDLLIQADLNYALIVREKSIRGDIEFLQFDIVNALEGNGKEDLFLKEKDQLIVFSRYQLKEREMLALNNLALTKNQQLKRRNLKLWHKYEDTKFKEFVGYKDSDYLDGLGDESKYALFSRFVLLKPFILKIKEQSNTIEKQYISEILGHVNYPGEYPLPENGNIKDLITAAGGFKESAYLKYAEITRRSDTNDALIEHLSINFESESESESEFVLKSKDIVNIFPKPNWQEALKVQIGGEVKFPGFYTVKRGEALRAVIHRAGGLTDIADINAAVFTRESIRLKEKDQLTDLSEKLRQEIASKSIQSTATSTKFSYEETKNLLDDISKVKAVGRLVINLPEIINNKTTLTLQNGDVLFVPSIKESISIIGEVNLSTSHLFKVGKSIDDYIEISGGLKERAADDQIYVIKANGEVKIDKSLSWFDVSNEQFLQPGDTIVVPLDTEHMTNLTLWSTSTRVIYQLGVAVAAISSL